MSDVEFQFYGVPNRYQDVIQRMAVMYAIRQPARTLDDVRDMTALLLDQWRARVGALISAGWEPNIGARSQHSILYARNCKPTFTISSHRTRPCKNTAVCPWCYARWVRDVWRSIDANMPAPDLVEPTPEEIAAGRELRSIVIDDGDPDPPRRHTTEFRYHLVERHHYFYRDVLPEPNPGGLTISTNLEGLLNNIEEQRTALVRMVDPAAAFLYNTLEPWEQGRQWKIHSRQLFKLLPEHDFPAQVVEATQGRVVRHTRPTRREVIQIVARICRYPVDLMIGDPDRTVELLHTRRRIRFRSYVRYRGFRQTHNT